MHSTEEKARIVVVLPKKEKEIYLEKINKLGQTMSTAIRRALKKYLRINN